MTQAGKGIGGYMGKILRVDLTKENFKDEVIDPAILRQYVGGIGLGTKIIYDEVQPDVMPFDPDNRIVFMTGPLTGTAAPGSCRYEVHTLCTYNPKLCTSAYGGGFWAPELKWSGYDGIIIQGKSPNPVYLWIHDSKAEIRDASKIWGKDTHETEDLVREAIGAKVRVAAIGPAAENMMRGCIISNDKNHVASKGGEVLGSKNLKAIAVGGGKREPIPVFDPEGTKQLAKQWRESFSKGSGMRRKGAGNLRHWGNPEFFGDKSPWILWVKNMSDSEFAYEYGKAMWGVVEHSKVTPVLCYNCTIGCAYDCEIGSGPYKGEKLPYRAEQRIMKGLRGISASKMLERSSILRIF